MFARSCRVKYECRQTSEEMRLTKCRRTTRKLELLSREEEVDRILLRRRKL